MGSWCSALGSQKFGARLVSFLMLPFIIDAGNMAMAHNENIHDPLNTEQSILNSIYNQNDNQ